MFQIMKFTHGNDFFALCTLGMTRFTKVLVLVMDFLLRNYILQRNERIYIFKRGKTELDSGSEINKNEHYNTKQ